MSGIRRSTLDNGLRIVTEALPALRSVTIGAWVNTGSRDETDEIAGASHFLEHLLFKGTPTRSARDIAESVESVGGEMNAFTGQEQTVFYIRVPARELGLAASILTDVLWRPSFRADEVESERRVILEELAMRDDTPDDLVHDLFAEAIFPHHELGRAIIGSAETVGGVSREAIADYHDRHYRPGNIVFAVAGDIDHDEVVAAIAADAAPRGGDRPERALSAMEPATAGGHADRDIEQTHMVLGVRALPELDPDRYALAVVNQAFGGGMSSRLFQSVREERGLAYSVFSYRAGFTEAGAFAIYAGTSNERADETLGVVRDELDRLRRDGLTGDEVAAAKGHITGALLMSLETSASRMRRLGRGELVEGEIPSLDEIVARVEAVAMDDVERVLDRVVRAGADETLVTVGARG